MNLWKIIKNFYKTFFLGDNYNTTTTSTVTDTTTTAKNKKKLVLSLGINDYPGFNNDLKGCVPDAKNWNKFLISKGFENIGLLKDSECTKKNLKAKINSMAKKVSEGDEIVITYSGHGTTVRDKSGDEIDGKDEAWCLYDGTFIDDDIKKLLAKFKEGVKITIISDSCHSGTVTRAMLLASGQNTRVVPRYMPPIDDIEANHLASQQIKKTVFVPRENMREILISGCKSTEYSYDANIDNKATGAFTYYALQILKKNPKITYNDFYKKLKKVLPSSRFPQSPQLESSDINKNSIMFD